MALVFVGCAGQRLAVETASGSIQNICRQGSELGFERPSGNSLGTGATNYANYSLNAAAQDNFRCCCLPHWAGEAGAWVTSRRAAAARQLDKVSGPSSELILMPILSGLAGGHWAQTVRSLWLADGHANEKQIDATFKTSASKRETVLMRMVVMAASRQAH